jgi:glyoxylase-like metal-dependent hydrolase (beta-lactamase superfamily II)
MLKRKRQKLKRKNRVRRVHLHFDHAHNVDLFPRARFVVSEREWECAAQRILERADRIVPGHFPELIRQPDGNFVWEDSAPFELLVR